MIGGGNMGGALVGGALAAGTIASGDLAIVEKLESRRAELTDLFPGVAIVDEVPPSRSCVIAVKPDDVAAAVSSAVAAGATRLLSIAAGVTIATIEAAAREPVVVMRSMPNTPALVGEGVTALAASSSATEADVAWARQLLAGVGLVVDVKEVQLDAVTGLTGSGPAYVFLIAEALADAGVTVGLSRAQSEAMVAQLLVGSSALLRERGDAARLRTMVTSPGGTTAAGLLTLEQRGVRAAIIDAVRSATARSRELGET